MQFMSTNLGFSSKNPISRDSTSTLQKSETRFRYYNRDILLVLSLLAARWPNWHLQRDEACTTALHLDAPEKKCPFASNDSFSLVLRIASGFI